MAAEPPQVGSNPLLRGLFGVFQQGARLRQDTASIWEGLRVNAGSWLAAAQGLPKPWDPAALSEAGRGILSAQGVNGATVSTFRGIAGQWLQAKRNLHALDPDAQITASAIFRAPWARTTSNLVPSRYRLRTAWQVETSPGEFETAWKTDEFDEPLTSTSDLLARAAVLPTIDSPDKIKQSLSPPTLSDYELEQI